MTINSVTLPASAENLREERVLPFKKNLNQEKPSPVLDQVVEDFSLNGEWKFIKTDEDTIEPLLDAKKFSQWKNIIVPSNWFLGGQKSYPAEGKGMDYHGTIWYATKFTVPEKYQGKCLTLQFDMVDYYADVFLNGSFVGKHQGCFWIQR
jgi:beta-mannosidase